MDKAYAGIIISDIHFGALKPLDLYNQLKESFLDYIEKLAIIDFIVITGDLFDSRISLNSDHAKVAIQFIKRIIEICRNKNTKIRIIKGTESHDNKQLDILDIFYNNNDIDFKIINTVSDEYLFDNFKVLYIPEEYMENKDEYYSNYFNNTYDMIFGHGLVNDVMFIASKQESEITMSKAPVFKTENLINICKGPIFFGHIHTPQIIKKKFYYVGSFSRWSFGEEEDKGFYLVSYVPGNGKYKTEFIKNKLAKTYNTVRIDESSPLFNENVDNIINNMITFINTFTADYLRFVVSIPEDYENPLLLTNMLNEIFSKFNHVKLVVNNNNKLKQKKNMEEKINLLLDKYGFIFDKNLDHDEKISKFLKIKYNKNIPINKLRDYLYQHIVR